MEKIITDTVGEKIIVKWDGTRFSLVSETGESYDTTVVILNPREMGELIQFVMNQEVYNAISRFILSRWRTNPY